MFRSLGSFYINGIKNKAINTSAHVVTSTDDIFKFLKRVSVSKNQTKLEINGKNVKSKYAQTLAISSPY